MMTDNEYEEFVRSLLDIVTPLMGNDDMRVKFVASCVVATVASAEADIGMLELAKLCQEILAEVNS